MKSLHFFENHPYTYDLLWSAYQYWLCFRPPNIVSVPKISTQFLHSKPSMPVPGSCACRQIKHANINEKRRMCTLARFYATTEQKLIHSFWNALRIHRKINQLHQSSCYTSSIYYTTQNNPWICRYRTVVLFYFTCMKGDTENK
jgi:hypothetical protein